MSVRYDRGAEPFSLGRAEVIVETVKAICVRLFDHPSDYVNPKTRKHEKGQPREVWIPKSVIHDDSEVWEEKNGNDEGELFVKQWFAEKEGFDE